MVQFETNPLPDAERTNAMTNARAPWLVRADRAKRVDDQETAGAYGAIAYDAAEAAGRDYDREHGQRPDITPVSMRVIEGMERLEIEAANPYYAYGQDWIVGGGAKKEDLGIFIDGRPLIDSHQTTEPAWREEETNKEGTLKTLVGYQTIPDTDWNTVFDKIVAMATGGNPAWQEEQLPDLRTADEMNVLRQQQESDSSLSNADLAYRLTSIYNPGVEDYGRLRDHFEMWRAPTELGVDLVYI